MATSTVIKLAPVTEISAIASRILGMAKGHQGHAASDDQGKPATKDHARKYVPSVGVCAEPVRTRKPAQPLRRVDSDGVIQPEHASGCGAQHNERQNDQCRHDRPTTQCAK